MTTDIPRLATLKEAAGLTGLSYGFLRQKALSGEIVAVRAGRKFLINIDRLVDYLNGENISAYRKEEAATIPNNVLELDVMSMKPRKGITPIQLK